MLDQLKQAKERFENIGEKLSDPNVISDQTEFKRLMKENKSLLPVVEKYDEYMSACKAESDALELIEAGIIDADFKEMVQDELRGAREKKQTSFEQLTILLLPCDPNDDKSIIMEIRGGAGGEEAALFANSLFRMYSMYAQVKGWTVEVINMNDTELGGIKEVAFSIEGEGAYSRLKFESGVHRVQRVPETESSGRIHTSTVTVAVLPEMEEVEVEINPGDLDIATCRSSGAGGQHVNKTESAIRIVHKPTGIVVECQDERSQYKNKDKAMKVLRAKLYEKKQAEVTSVITDKRRSQVGTGDRSERIRTFNFPQGRVTDHRIGLTLYRIESLLNGDIDELLDALNSYNQAERLKSGEAIR